MNSSCAIAKEMQKDVQLLATVHQPFKGHFKPHIKIFKGSHEILKVTQAITAIQ